MPTFKAMIFDFNGVLWWDTHLQEESWGQFIHQLRDTEFSPAEMAERVHGRTHKDTLEYVLGRPVGPDELAALIQQKETIYRKLCLELGTDFKLSPGAVDLLDFLAQRRIPRTIATASEISNVRFFIQHLKLDRWFDPAAIVYDDGTYPGKPAPDIYRIAASKLNLPPADCVVVEDSLSGLAAAYAAEIGKIVAMRSPGSSDDELSRMPGVSGVISSLDELDRAMFCLED
jgi:beta-phosphoglucomutase-like phosphatase (HAD superfamily)